MQLAIPIFKNNKIYDRVEYRKPKAGVIANVQEIYEEAGAFSAMLEFVAGSVTSFTSVDGETVDNKEEIKSLCRLMPYMSADALSIKIMALVNKDDKVEGIYPCPRCGHNMITGISDIGDTRDTISDLKITCMEDNYYNEIHVDLEESVLIQNAKTKEVIEEVKSFDLRFPTLNDCITGSFKYPENKDIRRQYSIYVSAIRKVNGNEIDNNWRNSWGLFVMERVDTDDVFKIVDELKKYGLENTVERVCIKCGREYKAPINTSNFFASGLQQA